jgi:hypothetical protein
MTDQPTTANWLDLRRKISVKRAAELNNVSEDSFRRHHAHLIKKVSPRRDAVELGDALAVGTSTQRKTGAREKRPFHCVRPVGSTSNSEGQWEGFEWKTEETAGEHPGRLPIPERTGDRHESDRAKLTEWLTPTRRSTPPKQHLAQKCRR